LGVVSLTKKQYRDVGGDQGGCSSWTPRSTELGMQCCRCWRKNGFR
jgi:hypothetical protein